MFGGEIVKKKFPLKKHLDLEKIFGPRQSPTQGPSQIWTWKIFTKNFFL